MKYLYVLFAFLILPWSTQAQDYKQEREKMVSEQIARRGIKHVQTLDAMRKVERHLFVPPGNTRMAYADSPLAIGYGQTISQPYIVAYMTQIIEPKSTHKILEIGTGSGYQAAVLAEIVDKVYTIEIVPELGETATDRLRKLGYDNVEVIKADGYNGLEEHAPFDAIVVTAASEHIPPSLIQQLKEGGKMIIPVGSPFLVQTLMLVEKKKGKLSTSSLMPVRFVPFTRSRE
ncbi:MAG: protein-L-isoaspartate(D-aspartate) O-methyltransferase [Bacteroidales bacterium]|nr:protein-L-isoaspartate(D-aspartate) O-methyltransferase [Bacteroidales bacterium]